MADAIRKVFCMKQDVHDECYLKDKMQKAFLKTIKVEANDFLSAEIGKYAIPCKDRISVCIREMQLKDDKGNVQPIQLEDASYVCDTNNLLIVFILESPGKEEYNCKKVKEWPEPARGQTGRNINQYFVPLVKKCFKNWRIGLINPIQYSCSLGNILPTTIKDRVFGDLFNDGIKDDFVDRFELMCKCNECIIVNCCTSCNSSKIDDVLRSKKIPFLKMAHPSSLCFTKQCGENEGFNCSSRCKIILHMPTGQSYVTSEVMLSVDALKNAICNYSNIKTKVTTIP